MIQNGHVISFVGAGGKTTLMYALAEHFTRKGARTIVTTTTHIYQPMESLWAKKAGDIRRLWERGSYAVIGLPCENGKIKSLPQQELDPYIQMADVTLIEADGARRMPCKIPAGHEPVLLEACDIVIGVMGMDAVGRPLKEVCFRFEKALRFLDASPDDILTTEMAAKILTSEEGTRKNVGERDYYVFLNKCDLKKCFHAGKQVQQALKAYGVLSVLTGFSER